MADPMKVVLHYPNRSAPPQGVWWWDGQSARMGRFYHDKDMAILGNAEMGRVAADPGSFDVDEFFESLSERMVLQSVWTVATVKEMSPVEYLNFIRKQYVKPKPEPKPKAAMLKEAA